MEDLIKALQIFLKYGNPYSPINCEYYKVMVVKISPNLVSCEDKKELEKLSFFVCDNYFQSFRFGYSGERTFEVGRNR